MLLFHIFLTSFEGFISCFDDRETSGRNGHIRIISSGRSNDVNAVDLVVGNGL